MPIKRYNKTFMLRVIEVINGRKRKSDIVEALGAASYAAASHAMVNALRQGAREGRIVVDWKERLD